MKNEAPHEWQGSAESLGGRPAEHNPELPPSQLDRQCTACGCWYPASEFRGLGILCPDCLEAEPAIEESHA